MKITLKPAQSSILSPQRYGVGECEMLARIKGEWLFTDDVRQAIDEILDEDDKEIMLAKLEELRRNVAP